MRGPYFGRFLYGPRVLLVTVEADTSEPEFTREDGALTRRLPVDGIMMLLLRFFESSGLGESPLLDLRDVGSTLDEVLAWWMVEICRLS